MSWSPDRGPDVLALPYKAGPVSGPEVSWYGRRGRLTPRQVADLAELYERFGLATPEAVHAWRPEVLEIGFGSGESVLGLAAADQTTRVLGVETFSPGLLALMRGLDAAGIDNVKVTRANVVTLLPKLAADQLTLVRVFFPDPWPKRRHAARRLVRAGFVARVTDLLAPGGVLHVVTDSASYAQDVAALVSSVDRLAPIPPPGRGTTRYEARALLAGRAVHDLAWRR